VWEISTDVVGWRYVRHGRRHAPTAFSSKSTFSHAILCAKNLPCNALLGTPGGPVIWVGNWKAVPALPSGYTDTYKRTLNTWNSTRTLYWSKRYYRNVACSRDFLLGCCHSQVDGHSDPAPTSFVGEHFYPPHFTYWSVVLTSILPRVDLFLEQNVTWKAKSQKRTRRPASTDIARPNTRKRNAIPFPSRYGNLRSSFKSINTQLRKNGGEISSHRMVCWRSSQNVCSLRSDMRMKRSGT
jgi:hypothetical protein